MTMPADFLFAWWPYAALVLFLAGITGRCLQMRRRLPPSPYELGRASAQFKGGRAWRLSLGLLVLAHAAGLALPRAVSAWDGAPWRLYLLEGAGLVIGVTATLACARLIGRFLERVSQARAAEVADSIFFSLLFVALASGVLVAVTYRWASSWAVGTVAPYVASLVAGRPSAVLVEHLPFLVRLHVVASLTALAVVPYTRLTLFVLVGVHRAWTLAAAAEGAVAGRASAWWRRRDRLAWLWPEAEARWLSETSSEADARRASETSGARVRRREMDARVYESGESGT